MTIADLEPWGEVGVKDSTPLRAVGWLGRELPFKTGPTSFELYGCLQKLLKDPFQPFVSIGFHSCELCQHEGEATGTLNLFVPSDGILFICPELILHYINAHSYLPPAEFCDAVMACPDTRTMAYKRLFLENGGRQLRFI